MKADVGLWTKNFKELVKRMEAVQATAQKAVKLLADKSVATLDERWAMFLVLSPALPIARYGDGHVDVVAGHRSSAYDEFYTERYETCYYADLWEMVGERLAAGKYTQASVDAWREAVLAKGECGFRYDW